MRDKVNQMAINAKIWMQKFAKEEDGDFGVGQIAAIVASVVIIGLVVTIVTNNMPDWITTIWDQINSWFARITP